MKHLLLLFIMAVTLSCCNKNDDQSANPIDQLPPATQTGENTFGFLLNGEPQSITNSSQMSAIYQGGFVQFGAGGVFITLNNPFEIDINYDLAGKARYIEDNGQQSCYYDFEDSFEGNIIFTKIDQVNYIISGTFEFSTVNDVCEVVMITNGRFDMQYIP